MHYYDLHFNSKINYPHISFTGDDVADPNFFPRLVGDYIPQNCWNFTYGDWRMREFYSPRYPHNYINDTSCIQQLIGTCRICEIHSIILRDDKKNRRLIEDVVNKMYILRVFEIRPSLHFDIIRYHVSILKLY